MQALYRTWRPQTFNDVVGQEAIVQTLQNALHSGHIHHAYLFAGPRGTGKTTLARLVAKAVNCLAPANQRPCGTCVPCQAIANGEALDLYEIDAASHTGVDNIRDILDKVALRPGMLRYKVYIIDEVHMLSTAAFNALLKTLEEPPEHVIFILATTEAHKIPATVLSRCQRYEFRRLALTQIVGRLQTICAAENLQADPEALDLIARAATGSLRDALTLLDQARAHGPITLNTVRTMLGVERRDVIARLAQAWVESNLQSGLETINRAVDAGADPRQLARQLTDLLRGLLLIRMGAGDTWQDITPEERPYYTSLAQRADPQRLARAIRIFSQAATETRTAWHPQLPLELALAEAVLTGAESQPSGVAVLSPGPASSASVSHSVSGPSATALTGGPTPIPRPEPATAKPAPESVATRPTVAAPHIPTPSVPTTAPTSIPAATSSVANAPDLSTIPQPAPVATSAPALPDTLGNTDAPPSLYAQAVTHWSDIFNAMRKLGAPLQALYHDARPVGSEPGIDLVIGFRYPIHCQRAAQEENLKKVEQFLSTYFGRTVHIKCVPAEQWQPAGRPAASAPASKPASAPTSKPAPRSTPSMRPPTMPPDPMDDEVVRRAMDELGAVPE